MLAAGDAMGPTDGPASLAAHGHLLCKGDVPSQDTEPTECANPPPRCPTPLTVPSRVLWGAAVPIQHPIRVLPWHPARPLSVTAAPSWGRGLQKGQTCVVVLPGRGDTGTREAASGCSQPAPALSPSRGGQCPGSPAAPRSLGACSHGARERRAPAVPSLPALSPSLPAFFSLFFFSPPNTSPRNARGGGSTISHCERLSLYCSARQNTARPPNKHPFICRPQRRGIQGKCQHHTGLRQPLGPAKPPLGIGPRCRDSALCSRQTSGQQLILCSPPIKSLMRRCCSRPLGLLRVVQGGVPPLLRPTSLILPCEKTLERLPHRHLGAGMLPGAKHSHTMGLCSWLPYLLPPPGSISKGGGSFSQRKHKTSSVCPQHQRTQ